MKRISLLFGVALLLTSCNSFSQDKTAEAQTEEKTTEPITTPGAQSADENFEKGNDGLEYKKVTEGTGTVSGKPGDFAEMHVIFKLGDSVIINTYEMNQHMPVMQQLQEPTMKGDLMGGILSMKAGDSTVFRMLADTFMTRSGQPKPEWLRPGDYASWEVKMVSLKSKEQMEAESREKDKTAMAADDKIIKEYLQQKGIKNAKKDASGMYYVIHKPGTGAAPKEGQNVTVNYTGYNLKGEKFDSNVDPAFNHVEPFSFNLGKGSVIKGWDKGVALMKKGMKATFYIPSALAYGERGAGDRIPPNAILAFDIELLNIQ